MRKDDDVLRIGIIDTPATLNPFALNSIWDDAVLNLVYDCLAISSAAEPYSPEPWLAEEWVWDRSGLKLTVSLKSGVRWHDGTPLTAEDVKFTFELINEFSFSSSIGNTFFIDKVSAADQNTVEFSLSEPRATFIPITLCNIPIVPKHIWEAVAEKARASSDPRETLLQYRNDDPVGSGPFKLRELEPDVYIRLDTNKEFFAGSPNIDGIMFRIFKTDDKFGHKYLDDYYSEEQAIIALREGELDYLGVHYPVHTILDLIRDPDPGISVSLNPTNGILYFAFNCRRRPFDDVDFRRAVACLVDRETYCKYQYMGQAVPIYTPIPASASQWINPNVPRYGEGLRNKSERQQKAKEILADAGYVWKNGRICMPNGEPFRELSICTDNRIMGRTGLAGDLAFQLREIGVPVTSHPVPPGDLRRVEEGFDRDFDMMIGEYWFALPFDPDCLCAFFHSSQAGRGLNSTGYENPDFDELAIKQRGELQLEKRKALVAEMQDILMQDVPWIPMNSNIRIEVYRNDTYEGWVQRPKGCAPYYQKWSYLAVRRTGALSDMKVKESLQILTRWIELRSRATVDSI